jgi:hypothetical protein
LTGADFFASAGLLAAATLDADFTLAVERDSFLGLFKRELALTCLAWCFASTACGFLCAGFFADDLAAVFTGTFLF